MKKNYWVLVLFVLAKFILQYSLISPEYELHRDEYLHLDQANHLAWGYLSVPPVNSWLAWLIKELGNTVFWVKFFPALFGALTIVLTWKTVEELNGSLFAKILASLGILFSVLLRVNMLFQPTSLEIFLWLFLYFSLIRYFNSRKVKWLYIGAVIFGIGILNKYNIAFSLLGLVPALLLTEQRKIFMQPHLYWAALLALIIISPNLLWQYQNQFPVIHHMKELSERQLVHVSSAEFMKSQALFFVGVFFVMIAGWGALLLYKPFEKFRVFFWSYIITITLFLFFKAKDYYAIGLYPVYIAFGSVFLGNIFENGWKRFLKPVSISIPVLLFLPLYNLAFPNKSPEYIETHQDQYRKIGLLRWEDGKDHSLPQDFADMQGWRELAQKVDKQYSQLSKSGNTLVLCDNYGQAGAINYYSEIGVKAISLNADYINWIDLSKKYKNVIRVKDASEAGKELKESGPFFELSGLKDSIANPYARERGTAVFSLQGAKTDINKRIQDEIDETRDRWKK
ncbi:glycosyltransferase family 39 protein [Chryseobacterium arthrosphaerae]|uniref:Glycosyl transferase n=2 Tax=Chryseobacterium arthrosphaerae TaxID=651561 RepID=A0A1B8ZTU8_9FLAO|nr:glycosyltransferase family 39 protein [Chryseobacterium arthrosphaerae]OCA75016.1 glycosyl transferase [Chryseobacterium arthrosphaerae]